MNQALAQQAAATIQAGSKSFALAAQLFAPATRSDAMMLYSWCRYCDDLVDGQQLGFGQQHLPIEAGRERLADLEAMTRRVFRGDGLTYQGDGLACDRDGNAYSAFAALQAVVERHPIPLRYPLEHLQGFAMDVERFHYRSIEDTLLYCYRVAGVVGLMMAIIMGAKDEATLDRACDLGIAFQLTNIARDIVEDAAVGRCYLPETWLREMNLSPHQLGEPRFRPQLAVLARRLVELAEPYYRSARAGLSALPSRSAWAVATALLVYRQIGLRLVKAGAGAWDRRLSTSTADKLRLLVAGALLTGRSRLSRPGSRPQELWRRPL